MELALVLPLVVVFVLGLLQVALVARDQLAVELAAREAAARRRRLCRTSDSRPCRRRSGNDAATALRRRERRCGDRDRDASATAASPTWRSSAG